MSLTTDERSAADAATKDDSRKKNTKNAETETFVFAILAFFRGKNLRKKTKLLGIVVRINTVKQEAGAGSKLACW